MEALPENQCFTVLNAPRSVGDRPFQRLEWVEVRWVWGGGVLGGKSLDGPVGLGGLGGETRLDASHEHK